MYSQNKIFMPGKTIQITKITMKNAKNTTLRQNHAAAGHITE